MYNVTMQNVKLIQYFLTTLIAPARIAPVNSWHSFHAKTLFLSAASAHTIVVLVYCVWLK